MRYVVPERVHEFTVTVPAGIETRLPNGCTIICSGTTGSYEVRGSLTEDGPIVEIVSYQNSGQILRT